MARNLVYYCTFGRLFHKMTELSVRALRTAGGYDGDVLVIGDQSVRWANHFVKVEKPARRGAMYQFRAQAWQCFDFQKYEQVLYLDGDILPIAPVQSLFDYQSGKLCLTVEPLPLRDCGPLMTRFLTDIKDASVFGINSGSFRVSGSQMKPFFDRWNRTFDQKVGDDETIGMDQAVLNHMVFDGALDCVTWPPYWIDFPGLIKLQDRQIGADQKCLHFIGKNEKPWKKLKRMRRYDRRLRHETWLNRWRWLIGRMPVAATDSES